MKKIIAFITAVAALSCTVTACGKSSDSSSSDNTASTSVASAEASTEDSSGNEAETTGETTEASTEEKTTEEKQQMSTEPSDTGLEDVFEVEDADYMDDLKDFIDCMNNKDFVSYTKYMFPEKLIDYATQTSGISIEELAKQMESQMSEDASSYLPVTIEKVVESKIDSDGADVSELIDTFQKTIEEIGDGKEEFGFDVKEYLSGISDPHYIAVEMKNAKGESDTHEFFVYHIKDEGWKFDLSLLSYVKKSKNASINSTANTLSMCVNAALTDMDAEGDNVFGKFIISSDKSLEKNIPSGLDTDKLKTYIKNYFDKLDDIEYFAVCDNGCCTYAVCQKSGDNYAGTYPAKTIYDKDGPKTGSGNESFSELYKACSENIG